MVPSPELKDLILQLYEGLSGIKPAGIAEDLFSKHAEFIAIGSGPAEWWQDSRFIIDSYRNRVSAGRSKIVVEKIESFREGSVGWVIDRVVLITPDGSEIPVRHTYIFHQETGNWKIIHAHYSLDVINEKL